MASVTTGPLSKKEAGALIRRRHPEWVEFQRRWRFLQDSLEGGNRYRDADYTVDPTARLQIPVNPLSTYNFGFDPATSEVYPFAYGQIVDRNLIPHLSEMGIDGRDLYVLRKHRTPIPTNLPRAIHSHLCRIYSREVMREGPDDLIGWWNDVDGSGQNIKRWMRETVAPLFLTLGQIDLVFDRPRPPEDVQILSRSDTRLYGLDVCEAGIILPENMVWWKLDRRTKLYSECLVFERCEDGEARYRHWTIDGSYVYDINGEYDSDESYEYPYGRPPIVRIFDVRKTRCNNVGQSRYEAIAEYQKAIYNATSELILSDCEQSHAQLSGPEDFLQAGSEVPIGPGNVLPMKKVVSGSSISYQGFSYIDPPKGAQAAIRQHILDFEDRADREAALLKPAGMTSGSTVAQSGISKLADSQDQNALLAEVASILQNLEIGIASMVLTVLRGEAPDEADLEAVQINYTRQFDLYTAGDLTAVLQDLQGIMALSGMLPETETELVQRLMQVALPGLTDDRNRIIRDEIEAFIKARSILREVPAQEESTAGVGPDEEDIEVSVEVPEGTSLASPPA